MEDATRGGADRDSVVASMASARGWNGIQLAVLAFIGFCGVVTDGRPDLPRWLQTLAATLSLVALALACVAVLLVAAVAWPLRTADDGDAASQVPDAYRRVRWGVALTFAAVASMALAASANWWPVAEAAPSESESAARLVIARDGAGNEWCGRLASGDGGAVTLDTARGGVELRLSALAVLAPVDRC